MGTRMIKRSTAAVAVAGLAALSLPIAADAAPRVAKGWPVMVPSGGELVQGPGKSFYLNGQTDAPNTWSISRYLPSGKRLSEQEDSPGCGNCIFDWTDYWSVGPSGISEPCFGAVTDAGVCTEVVGQADDTLFRKPGPSGWEYRYVGAGSAGPFADSPAAGKTAVQDAAATTYALLWRYERENDQHLPVTVAVTNAGTLGWDERFEEKRRTLTPIVGLTEGFLAGEFTPDGKERLVALGPDGSEKWGIAGSGEVVTDLARKRLYVTSGRIVKAINAETGKRLWRTSGRVLSVGRTGTVYIASGSASQERSGGRPGRYQVRAVSPARKLLWRQRTIDEVTSALELKDRRVVISTSEQSLVDGGNLALLNPRAREKKRARGRARLSRRVIYKGDGPKAPKTRFHRGKRTILSFDLPRASKVLVQYRDSSGRLVRRGSNALTRPLLAPAGRSFTTLEPPTNRLGKGSVVVRWTERGTRRTVSLPYVVAR